ncbi:MAG TPA: 3-hydroxyacyl-CoA dehydrogenase NAD-binding domain-containing protein [Vicinamibacterales bacterium]|nr:3-hydroxyacyl-CoA dehydrogenase NAD-binding domain-containing protein [Vicinamibacterales bacterium]
MVKDASPVLAVVGAGNMGSGIAQKMATEGFDVVLVDVDDEKVARGVGIIDRTLKEAVERGIMRPDRVAAIRDRIHGTSTFGELADAELVVEAVFEDRALKRDVFTRLESVCRPDTILATNTSSYLVSDIASAVKTPGRVLGLHYFFHPAKNRLVEVVAGKTTAKDVFRRAWALQEQLGKIPIASADASGFIVNRFFVVWLMEAIRMLEERVASAITIDEIAKKTFGVGMGPFELMNVSGVPIALHASTTIGDAYGAMYGPPPMLKQQVESGRMWPLGGTVDPTADRVVSERLMSGVFTAAKALVDEGVGTIEDVDIGARVGLRWRLGPFEMMNRRGGSHPIRLVKTSIENRVATITVNRPDAMNALNEAVAAQLTQAFHGAERDPGVTGIVIAGSGRSFVAGADIRFFIRNIERNDIAQTEAFTERLQTLFVEIQNCRKPVVARVHGLALGGGVELALACDYIVATPNATLGFPETGIGIYPGLGGTQRTTRRIGTGLAKWLVLTGDVIGAADALSIGLIDAVAPREELDAAIATLAAGGPSKERKPPAPPAAFQKLAAFFDGNGVETIRAGRADTGGDERLDRAMTAVAGKAPIALTLAASLIDDGARVSLEDGLRMELSHVREIFATKDALTGLLSIGKSRPVFEGA